MDTTKTTTHIGLCAGYGGIELGLKRVIPNLRSVALCEIEAFACANLVAKMEVGLMDCAPIWTDLKTFPWESFRDRVDILTGGYPCQPFSAAGKRLGTEDPRHLWPFIASGIRILRPKLCFFENVEGHISLGLREVIGELESIGYKVSWGIFSAREVGAPHQRKRVFILANAGRLKPQGWCGAADGQQSGAGRIPRGEPAPRHDQVWPSRPGQQQYAWEPPRVVGDSKNKRNLNEAEQDLSSAGADSHRAGESQRVENTGSLGRRGRSDGDERGLRGEIQVAGSCGSGAEEAMGNATMLDGAGQARGQRETQTWRTGATQHDRQAQPSMGRDADGPAGGMDYAELCVSCDNRTDELRLLGNGVVPATAERAFKTLLNELNT